MTDYGGFLFFINEPGRAAQLRDDIATRRSFTDVVSAPDWRLRDIEIFLISLTGHTVDYGALVRHGRVVASRKIHITFSKFVEFNPAVEFPDIERELHLPLDDYLSSTTGSRIEPEIWHRLLTTLKILEPSSSSGLDRLEGLQQKGQGPFYRPGVEVVTQEKDVVNIALRISGFDHTEILNWRLPDEGEPLAPFVKGLEKPSLREDQIIAHDAQVFGDWVLDKRAQIGTAIFVKDKERLIIVNVNRTKIEETLGVDLLYYHDRYQSYVMVQYKRLVEESGEACYRPTDKSYKNELKRMLNFHRILSEDESQREPSLSGYRLFPGFFYFKLCPAELLDPTSPDMIRGMYIPLDYWVTLLESPHIVGPQGGLRITFDNVGRYFNNTLFINLVEAGWIGSRKVDTAAITQVIQDALNGNRSVILAARHRTAQ